MLIVSLRNFSENHKFAAIAVGAVPLVLACVLVISHYTSPPEPDWPKAYFIDEETGDVSVRLADEFPPLPGADGKPTVVRAIYVTFSTPENKALAYLEKYTDQAKAQLQKDKGENKGIALAQPQLLSGLLVRRPDKGSPWLVAGSADAGKLMDEVFKPGPSGAPPRMCPP